VTPERLREVERLFHQARERTPAEREAWLARACADDPALQGEVESLLAQSQAGVIDAPVGALIAGLVPPASLLLTGRRLGVFEVERLLGVGGMGEVYRARDTRLGRKVAIKILPRAFKDDPDRLARFEREARVLASLNHPHIGAIYGLEEAEDLTALVMELVEGDDLSQRIERGAIPVTEALKIARQVAAALEAAHEQRIIHRDLKPANIKMRPDGTVKVLDFGLAKALDPHGSQMSDSTTSLTPSLPTQPGMIVGTTAYMSPEQARGQIVDRRTDIWAFGVLLYELLTGISPFGRRSMADTLASVLGTTPDYSVLPSDTPAIAQRLVRRCLERDPQRRLQHMGDVRIDVEEALAALTAADPPRAAEDEKTQPGQHRLAVAATSGILLLIAAAGFVGWTAARSRTSDHRTVTQTVIELPPGTPLTNGNFTTIALSPDGSTVAFAADASAGSQPISRSSQLYLRRLDRLKATSIPGTEGATKPFFSPDGQWVGFSVNGALKKIAIRGGAPQVICDTQAYNSVSWGDDGTIFFTTTDGSGLSRVSANGGTPQVLTTPNRDHRERTHRGPDALPGGTALIMTVATADITSYDDARIEVLTLATGQRRVLIQGGMNARYVSTGHLIYARAGSLLAVPFDLKRLEVTGPPIKVVDDVFTDPIMGLANFAISRDGSLLYAPGGARTHLNSLVWVDRQGRSVPVNGIRRPIASVRLSPDGQRIGLGLNGATSEVWLHDVARTTSTRLVYGWDNDSPIWSPDGTRVAFTSNRATPGGTNLFWQAADGTGVAERLTTNGSLNQTPESWSPDGRVLVFRQWEAATSSDLWVLSIAERTIRPLLQTRASESAARISPNGRWIAYESDQSGRFEVYVRAFPGPSRDWPVSLDGGSDPRWALNGRELFYRQDNKIMAVDVSTMREFASGTPRKLFDGAYVLWPGTYDVARDGRFLMLKNEAQPVSQLILIQNWFEELKATLAVGK